MNGTKLQRSTDINVGSGSVVNFTDTAGNVYPITRYGADRPFTNFARVIQFQSTAESNYNGATLEFNKRFSHNWQARLAYTFGKVLDTKPDATSVVPGGGDDAKQASDPKNFQADYAPGDADQRHRLVLSAYWSIPSDWNGDALERALFGGWSLSGIVTLASGQPYSPILSPLTDINNDGNNRNDRAPGFSRNSFNYPTFFSIDPRVTKDIPIGGATLQLIFEAFNILNRSNVTGLNQGYYGVNGRRSRLSRASARRPLRSVPASSSSRQRSFSEDRSFSEEREHPLRSLPADGPRRRGPSPESRCARRGAEAARAARAPP